MFPTLQCLDPWEFAVRLSQQRCARSYSLLLCLLLLSPALAVQYCIVQYSALVSSVVLNLNSAVLYLLNPAMCCADYPDCATGAVL